MRYLCVAATLVLFFGGNAFAQAPTLNRDYEVVAETTDWHQPRTINGIRFVVPADRTYSCTDRFYFAVTLEKPRPIDWNTDPAFDAAIVELASRVEQECPNLELIYYSAMPGFQSVRKRDDWHILRVAEQNKLRENEQLQAYYHQPMFPANGPNPLANRGYYASRLVAQDGELSLYQAFESAAYYAKNGAWSRLVLVQDIGPHDQIAILVNDEMHGGINYPQDFIDRLNGLLIQSGDKYLLKNSLGTNIYHYVTSYHVPAAARQPTVTIETPILISEFQMAVLKRGELPLIVRLNNYPRLAVCESCGGTTRTKIGQMMSKFNQTGYPLSAADIFPEAAQ